MVARSANINVMAKAAEKAAKGLVRDFGEVEQLQVSRKGPADFVSTADRRAEGILRDELRKARPDWGLLMEESGTIDGRDKSHRWIVDPLDGTTNFLHGIPHFAISIGLEREGEIVAGLVYEPLRDEMYWAEKGTGAFVNSRRLRVSARTQLSDAVIATGIPFRGHGNHARFEAEVRHVMAEVAGVRRFGSAALDLAYVAAGRYDGYWEHDLNPWDVAAGVLIVQEAGGFVSEVDGGKNPVSGRSVLASTPGLIQQLSTVLGRAGAAKAAAG